MCMQLTCACICIHTPQMHTSHPTYKCTYMQCITHMHMYAHHACRCLHVHTMHTPHICTNTCTQHTHAHTHTRALGISEAASPFHSLSAFRLKADCAAGQHAALLTRRPTGAGSIRVLGCWGTWQVAETEARGWSLSLWQRRVVNGDPRKRSALVPVPSRLLAAPPSPLGPVHPSRHSCSLLGHSERLEMSRGRSPDQERLSCCVFKTLPLSSSDKPSRGSFGLCGPNAGRS